MRQNKYEYDAFISHAVEDKIPIANDLCARLEAAGLKIWYSGKELGVGDSIEKTIEKGLNRSRYGIVIFSPTYLAKNWTIREFYTLLAKEIEEQKVILPVLYNISLDELKKKDMVMADRFAVNADKGLDVVVERLVREIKKSNAVTIARRPWLSRIRFFLFLSLLANVALLSKATFYSNGTFPEAPEQKFERIDYEETGVNPEALFADVEGFFSHLSNCTCQQEEGTFAPREKKHLVQNNPAGNNDVAGRPAMRSGTGKKMTIAVVFQIEQTGELPESAEEDAAKRNTINLREPDASFITASSRKLSQNLNSGCVHSSGLAK